MPTRNLRLLHPNPDLMKKLLSSICIAVFLAATSHAQVTNLPTTLTPEAKAAVLSFAQNVEAEKTITVAVYPTLAPSIVVDGKKNVWGAGIAAICPLDAISALSNNVVAQHAFAGLRFDLLGGKYFASTVALGAKADFQLWSHNFTAFGESGANIPLAGAGDNNIAVGAMVGSGIETRLFSFGKANASGIRPGSLSVFGVVEKWTLYPGYVLHPGASLTWSF